MTLRGCLISFVVLAAACTSVENAPPSSAQQSGDGTPEWVNAALGFDPTDSSARSPSFDGWSQLIRVTLEEGEHVRTWWLRVDAPQAPSPSDQSISFTMTSDGVTETIGIRMTSAALLLQEVGEESAHASLVTLPLRTSQQGMFDLCQTYLSHPANESSSPATPQLTREQRRLYGACASSLFALLRVVQGSDDLSKVLWSVVEKPNWVGVLFRGGNVALSIAPLFEKAESVSAKLPDPLASIPAARYPMNVDVNGTRALDCEITVCPAGPPLHMLGGIVRLVGMHPTRRERRVTIDVVGARGPD